MTRPLTAAQLQQEIGRHRPLTDHAQLDSRAAALGATEVVVDIGDYGAFQVRAVHLRQGRIVLEAEPLPISDDEAYRRG